MKRLQILLFVLIAPLVTGLPPAWGDGGFRSKVGEEVCKEMDFVRIGRNKKKIT